MSTEKQMTPLQQALQLIQTQIDLFPDFQSRSLAEDCVLEGLNRSKKICESLLPKEKEGIITAYREGFVSGINIPKPYKTDEQYFNSKYTQ